MVHLEHFLPNLLAGQEDSWRFGGLVTDLDGTFGSLVGLAHELPDVVAKFRWEREQAALRCLRPAAGHLEIWRCLVPTRGRVEGLSSPHILTCDVLE